MNRDSLIQTIKAKKIVIQPITTLETPLFPHFIQSLVSEKRLFEELDINNNSHITNNEAINDRRNGYYTQHIFYLTDQTQKPLYFIRRVRTIQKNGQKLYLMLSSKNQFFTPKNMSDMFKRGVFFTSFSSAAAALEETILTKTELALNKVRLNPKYYSRKQLLDNTLLKITIPIVKSIYSQNGKEYAEGEMVLLSQLLPTDTRETIEKEAEKIKKEFLLYAKRDECWRINSQYAIDLQPTFFLPNTEVFNTTFEINPLKREEMKKAITKILSSKRELYKKNMAGTYICKIDAISMEIEETCVTDKIDEMIVLGCL